MFLGQYEYTLDDKNRLTIPARFREGLEGGFVITRGLDRCLTIYPLEVWEGITARMEDLYMTDPRVRALRRLMFAEAVNVTPDRQGRVVIPDRLREYAGLQAGDNAVIVGLNRYLEVWNPQRWEDFNAQQLAAIEADPALWESLKI